MDFTVIRGSSIEEQIKSIDRFLGHAKRRLHKTVVMGISPIPISGFCSVEQDGTFFRYMSPVAGKTRDAQIFVAGQVKKGVTVTLTLFKVDGTQRRVTFPLVVGQLKTDADWDVSAGDRVKARIDNWDAMQQIVEEKAKTIISEIWIALTLFPDKTDCRFEKEAIEDEGLSE